MLSLVWGLWLFFATPMAALFFVNIIVTIIIYLFIYYFLLVLFVAKTHNKERRKSSLCNSLSTEYMTGGLSD